MRSVFIRKVKRAGATGVWGSYPVDQDAHGVWLYTPGESLYQATSVSGEVSVCYAGWPDPPGAPVIHLVPATGWWFARWQEMPPGRAHVAVDICTPSEFRDGIWSYDDLELDLIKFRDGTWRLDDEDEFERELALGRISSLERDASLKTLSELQVRLDRHDAVFDGLGWDRLERYRSQPFSPLNEFR